MGVYFKCPYCNSFGKWCLDNDKTFLDRIDFNKIDFDIYEVPMGSKKKVFIKCDNPKHGSNPFTIKYITHGLTPCECPKCHSIAQWGIDTICDEILENFNQIMKLKRIGINLFFTNIDYIKEKMLDELKID